MTNRSERGGALLLCIIVTLIILGISGAFLSFSTINSRKTATDMFGLQALYLAESGAAMYIHQVNSKPASGSPPTPASLANGRAVALGGGKYVVPTAGFVDYGANGIDDDRANGVDDDYEKNFLRFQVEGTYSGVTRRLEILLSRSAGGVYWNAVFAGNSNVPGSPYTLAFGGPRGNADIIKGDVYSGGDFSAGRDARLLNEAGQSTGSTVMFAGANLGGPGGPSYRQGTQQDLDIRRNAAGQSAWEEKAAQYRLANTRGVGREDPATRVKYFDVAWDLATMGGGAANNGGYATGASSGSPGSYGRADNQILTRDEPSHIFRKNPTQPDSSNDRTVNYAYVNTAKDDYYIEDPTHSTLKDISDLGYAINGDTTASGVYLSPNGNNAVYFVDGNLWVSHDWLKSYQWVKPAGATDMKVTIVVKGNVNFTDNLVYSSQKSQNDALAILSITDPARLNAVPANFSAATNLLPGTTVTVDQFVTDFNNRASRAGNDTNGQPKVPPLTLSKLLSGDAAERSRAASEFNRAYGSGNVFYGDPGSGTVEYFESFMYAENNFYATNLDSTTASGGTQRVEIFGNMTAGNHVSIMRDTTKAGYIPLMVSFDDRIRNPNGVKPPALPSTPGFGNGDWLIASWKQIP